MRSRQIASAQAAAARTAIQDRRRPGPIGQQRVSLKVQHFAADRRFAPCSGRRRAQQSRDFFQVLLPASLAVHQGRIPGHVNKKDAAGNSNGRGPFTAIAVILPSSFQRQKPRVIHRSLHGFSPHRRSRKCQWVATAPVTRALSMEMRAGDPRSRVLSYDNHQLSLEIR